MIKVSSSKIKNKEIKDLICLHVAKGEYPEFPMEIPDANKRGIFQSLVLDIASNGKAYQNAPHWYRKPRSR